MKKILNNAKKIGVDLSLNPEDLSSGKEHIGHSFISEIYNSFNNPYNVNEKECYIKIINKLLENDEEVKSFLPTNLTRYLKK